MPVDSHIVLVVFIVVVFVVVVFVVVVFVVVVFVVGVFVVFVVGKMQLKTYVRESVKYLSV